MISGSGRAPQQRADALVEQLVWAGVRRRRVLARTALSNQLLGTLDLVFPGLDGCFDDLLGSKVGPVLLHELADPARLHRLGVEGLRAFTARRGVRLQRAKAARRGQGISREGNAQLRDAIIELGRGLAQREGDFARYKASVSGRMKPLPAAIAVGHRAHRLAFALMRSGEPYDPARLAESVTTGGERRKNKAGGPVNKISREAACRHDVNHPPATTVPQANSTRNTPARTGPRSVAGTRTNVDTAKLSSATSHRTTAGPDCVASKTPGPSH